MKPAVVAALVAGAFALGIFVGYVARPDAAAQRTTRAETNRDGGKDIAVRPLPPEGSSDSDRADAPDSPATKNTSEPQQTDGDVPAAESVVADKRSAFRPLMYETGKEAIKVVKWNAVGGAMAKLNPILVDIVRTARAGKEVTPKQMGQLMALMAPLVEQAMVLDKANVPGTNDNAQWTHPSVLANNIHATLLAAGRPLSEEQESELHGIGLRFIEEDARVRAGFSEEALSDEALTVERMVGEVDVRERFMTAVDAMLTGEQRAILHPPETVGRVGLDVFSGSSIWHEKTDFVSFSSRENLEQQIVAGHVAQMGLTDVHMQVLRDAVRAWSAGMSDKFLADGADGFTAEGHPVATRAMLCARLQAKMHRTLLDRTTLTKKQRDALIAHARITIPIAKSAE